MERVDPGAVETTDPEQEERAEARERWRCARCRTSITGPEAVIGVAGRPPVGAYVNPAGILFEVVTVAEAENLGVEGPQVPAFTWFPGYAWRLARCAGCGAHLGWHYDAVIPGVAPSTFWGLLPARLDTSG